MNPRGIKVTVNGFIGNLSTSNCQNVLLAIGVSPDSGMNNSAADLASTIWGEPAAIVYDVAAKPTEFTANYHVDSRGVRHFPTGGAGPLNYERAQNWRYEANHEEFKEMSESENENLTHMSQLRICCSGAVKITSVSIAYPMRPRRMGGGEARPAGKKQPKVRTRDPDERRAAREAAKEAVGNFTGAVLMEGIGMLMYDSD